MSCDAQIIVGMLMAFFVGAATAATIIHAKSSKHEKDKL